MKKTILILLMLAFASLKAQNISPLTVGEVHKIQSKVLGEERRLNIWLPLEYDKAKAYPVIYFLDGSMHEDFVHLSGLVQFFQLQFHMPDFILVGIANVDRKRDFTLATTDEELKKDIPTSGGSGKFIEFVRTELQPYIEKQFKSDGTKYIVGQSLGALVTTEILLKYPETFTHYLIVSPSLWWDNQSLLDGAETDLAKFPKGDRYVYVSVGKGEHPIMRRDAKKLAKLLKKSGIPGLTVDFNLMKDENHATILHNSIYAAFMRLYPLEH